MPENIARKVSEGVYVLHTNTAGGRVRFVTDSRYVAIQVSMDGLGKMLTELCQNEGTVNGCHPTDFGFASMAKSLGEVIANLTCI